MLRNHAINTIHNGHAVECTKDEYSDIREALNERAKHYKDVGDASRLRVTRSELQRLDAKFGANEQ